MEEMFTEVHFIPDTVLYLRQMYTCLSSFYSSGHKKRRWSFPIFSGKKKKLVAAKDGESDNCQTRNGFVNGGEQAVTQRNSFSITLSFRRTYLFL